ncbi:nitrilase family protein [Prevotella sp. E13-17]|uniref:nitrilase-related carbon-nitrogen hydrolase n=1 Tax=Prevotella sp. E13-17 TaxID=2913616 RepID=UPI001EDC5A00|nr:nitrilase-related carbon-nitrogen hydrolase [Prevotella sp. E13-17]UKK49748.1 nitrilase family protein [Prevotella sp. E13-17]
MKVALIQLDSQWCDVRQNIARASQYMRDVEADMYVLPEMWSTGFVIKPQGVAESESTSTSLQWMREMAFEKDCAICGSLAVSLADGSYRNRHYFVTKNSSFFYDKKHLFSHGKEDLNYQHGDVPVIVKYKDFRLLLQTCYDLRFPCFSRYGRAGEYDAIVYVANWPSSRRLAWDVLLKARAIENQCYVIGVNRVGSDETCIYDGGSAVIDPLGRILVDAKDKENVSSAELSLDNLQKIRSRFRVLDDRDLFTY